MRRKEDSALRSAKIERNTKETEISIKFEIDGNGRGEIDTGVGFFDHMLTGFAKHGLFNLKLEAAGDLFVDCHHTVEDVGIVLGKAIKEAVGDKEGIKRYGFFILPMDEALVLCALDLSGRACFVYDGEFKNERIGTMDTCMVEEFFRAVAVNAEMNLHIKVLSGGNDHHVAEAMFKAFAKALDRATTIDPRIEGVLSTKGTI